MICAKLNSIENKYSEISGWATSGDVKTESQKLVARKAKQKQFFFWEFSFLKRKSRAQVGQVYSTWHTNSIFNCISRNITYREIILNNEKCD